MSTLSGWAIKAKASIVAGFAAALVGRRATRQLYVKMHPVVLAVRGAEIKDTAQNELFATLDPGKMKRVTQWL